MNVSYRRRLTLQKIKLVHQVVYAIWKGFEIYFRTFKYEHLKQFIL